MWAASCLASCCASATCGLCSSVASCVSRCSARLGYCALFGLSLILLWLLRELASPLLQKIPCINNFAHTPPKRLVPDRCGSSFELGELVVLSLFSGVKDQNDRRDSWHHGGWAVKIGVWVLLIALMFFVPNPVISVYGEFH